MNHQLVLQFQGDDDDTLEKVIELEDRLIDALAGSTAVEVDGHEPGDGVTNLILLAKNAAKVWERSSPSSRTHRTNLMSTPWRFARSTARNLPFYGPSTTKVNSRWHEGQCFGGTRLKISGL
jgi:hypothetical protein